MFNIYGDAFSFRQAFAGTTKMQFLTLSNEEQKLFIEWVNSRDVCEDQSNEEPMDEGSDLTNTALSIDASGSGMDVIDNQLI